jgi:hypothetical protein
MAHVGASFATMGFGNNLVTTLPVRAQCDYNVTRLKRSRNRLFFKGNQRQRNVLPTSPSGRRARLRASGVIPWSRR